jgi:acyl carrier protein
MTAEEIKRVLFEELRNIAPESDPAAVDPDADLREELDIDSMDFLNLIIALHRRLKVEIPEADYAKLATVNGAVGYLLRAGTA